MFCRGYDGTLAIGILPVALFASGHTYFVQRLHERMGLEVYCVHATFQYSGTTGKRHRMRERMLWVVVSHGCSKRRPSHAWLRSARGLPSCMMYRLSISSIHCVRLLRSRHSPLSILGGVVGLGPPRQSGCPKCRVCCTSAPFRWHG